MACGASQFTLMMNLMTVLLLVLPVKVLLSPRGRGWCILSCYTPGGALLVPEGDSQGSTLERRQPATDRVLLCCVLSPYTSIRCSVSCILYTMGRSNLRALLRHNEVVFRLHPHYRHEKAEDMGLIQRIAPRINSRRHRHCS